MFNELISFSLTVSLMHQSSIEKVISLQETGKLIVDQKKKFIILSKELGQKLSDFCKG